MAKAVFSKEEAESLAIAFTPKKFPHSASAAAASFVAFQAEASRDGKMPSFQLDRIVSEQTGIAEIERISLDERVEREALTRLKDIQEQAYQQGYQLGLNDGSLKAFDESKSALEKNINHMEALLARIENLKRDLASFNEAHIVRLTYFMARKVAMSEITQKPELIVQIVKEAIEGAQNDESVVVRLSPDDFKFIDGIREKLGKEFESVKRAKLEASDDIHNGGCRIETNYGDVDATIEQRINKLWEALSEKLPRTKDSVGGPE
jgi:flagellar assembly protein FliH